MPGEREISVRVQNQGQFQIQSIQEELRTWVRNTLTKRWESAQIVTRGIVHQADQLPGFIAWLEGMPAGLVTYHVSGKACEIVSLDSLVEGRGIGSALIAAVQSEARQQGCRRVWLITTNDNLPALRFYQKRGFIIVAIYPNALQDSRRLKPLIPLIGLEGIPLRDEIELELAV